MKNNKQSVSNTNKQNILIINTTFYRGGAAQIARTLYNGLKNSMIFVPYFFFGRGKKSDDPYVIKNPFVFEPLLHLVFTRFLGIEGIGSYFSTLVLKSFIKNRKIDLIHIHNIHGYYLNFSFMEYIDSLNIPIVWTFHDVWPVTGRCAYFSNCEKWKTECNACPLISDYPKTYVDRSSYLFKKKKKIFSSLKNITIITPSKWLKDIVSRSFLKNKKIETIANGVDINLFKMMDKKKVRDTLNISLNQNIILYLASDIDDERKGFEYFIKSLYLIKHKKLTVLTVGSISSKTKKRMAEFSCIHFGKVRNKNEIASIYNAADIFVISSIDDNFPNTVLESLACGIPVVGFKTGGIPEQIDENCGILVNKGDIKGFSTAIEFLFEDKVRLSLMSKKCREYCESHFSLDLMVEKYKALYASKFKK